MQLKLTRLCDFIELVSAQYDTTKRQCSCYRSKPRVNNSTHWWMHIKHSKLCVNKHQFDLPVSQIYSNQTVIGINLIILRWTALNFGLYEFFAYSNPVKFLWTLNEYRINGWDCVWMTWVPTLLWDGSVRWLSAKLDFRSITARKYAGTESHTA